MVRRRTPEGDDSILVLDGLGRSLTAAARLGKLDMIIGRDREMQEVMQVLSLRTTKNYPVLIGEPGVGKTAIVERLAQAIAFGEVPKPLRGKQIYALDHDLVEADSDSQDFGSRLEKVLDVVSARDDVILFIDELQTLLGAGNAVKAIGAASILKPKLARGELQTIGATTPDAYRIYIEKDAALERRFQPVHVGEPTVAVTIEILKVVRDRYETHHRVSITDSALTAAATLADRYIYDRSLPGKAIDLLDEAGARLLVRRTVLPADLREFDEKIAMARHDKEAAIDDQDFEKAANLRDLEKQLVVQRGNRERQWRFGGPDTPPEVDEVLSEVDDTDIARRSR